MADIEQAISLLEEQKGRKLTEQERKALEGFGEFINMMWNNSYENTSSAKKELIQTGDVQNEYVWR